MIRTMIFQKVSQALNLNKQILELNEIVKNNPNDIPALEELGAIFYYQKKDDVAIDIYEKLANLEPENSSIRAFLGFLYYEIEQLDKAIDELNTSLELSPNSPFVYFMLGNAYSRSGYIKEAIDCYDLAIFLDFDIYSAHIDFAKKYEDMGRFGKALKEYKAAYGIDPRDKTVKDKIEELKQKI